jgi:hypothetical protein
MILYELNLYLNATGSSRRMACSVLNCTNSIGRKFLRTGNSSVKRAVAKSAATHGVTIQVGAPICKDCFKVYRLPFRDPADERARFAAFRRRAADEAANARSARGSILGKRKPEEPEETSSPSRASRSSALPATSLSSGGSTATALPQLSDKTLSMPPSDDGGGQSINAQQQDASAALAAWPSDWIKLQQFVVEKGPLLIEPNAMLPADQKVSFLYLWDVSEMSFLGVAAIGPTESLEQFWSHGIRSVTESGKLHLMLSRALLNQLLERAVLHRSDLSEWIRMFRAAVDVGRRESDEQDMPELSAAQRSEYVRWVWEQLLDGDALLNPNKNYAGWDAWL